MPQANSIESLFNAFVAECRSLLDKLKGYEDEPLRLFVRPSERVRWLAQQAEQSQQFAGFTAVLPAPSDEILAGQLGFDPAYPHSSWSDPYHWFIRNIGFYHDLIEGRPPSLSSVLDRWNQQRWGSRRLYLLDHLSIDPPGFAVGDARIHPMTEAELDRFFSNRAQSVFGRALDLRTLVGGVFLDVRFDQVNLEDFHYGPDRTYPWLVFLNLLYPDGIAVSATYERPEFDAYPYGPLIDEGNLDRHPSRATPVARSSERLLHSLTELEKGRTAAASHRVELALKCFGRACKALPFVCGEEPPPESASHDHKPELPFIQDALERALVDLTTALEALYLDSSRGQKTSRLVIRAGSLLSGDDADIPAMQDRIRTAYNVRSRLVHGDATPPYSLLIDSVAFLRKCARRSLVAILRLKGSQERIIAGVEDVLVRSQNRLLVPE
jgi:hypothetical protein